MTKYISDMYLYKLWLFIVPELNRERCVRRL